jgi:ribose transport system ATP-binding protein
MTDQSPLAAANDYVLEMRNISKSFPGVQALENVNFSVRRGEVHALLGENGAGKSTLMKILAGAYQLDSGEVLLDGQLVAITDPIAAQHLGVSMIYQELNLVPQISVAENIFLGRLPAQGGWGHLNWKVLRSRSAELLARLHLQIDPRTPVKRLSVAQRQMVEIAKALSQRAKIIVMDEPTSALTLAETQALFGIIRDLQQEGVAVIFITHRLDEIFQVADRITVLRDGRHISTRWIAGLDQAAVVSMMVGRELTTLFPKLEAEIGELVLRIRGLNKAGLLHDINLEVRKGEIVGLAGLVGAGRTDLARAIFGITPPDSGEIWVEERPCIIHSAGQAIQLGLGLVPEDRKEEALFLARPVRDNITIAIINGLSWLGFSIHHGREDRLVADYIERLRIKTPSSGQLVRNLSGGNQQKTVIARWLAAKPRLLIMDEPTRGIDVGAKAEIHELMGMLAQQGVGILMISSELPEVLGVADRIVVMHEGRITGEFNRSQATQELIMQAATGGNYR